MAGHKITVDIDRQFQLIGIATTIRDYKLCHIVQVYIDCEFVRIADSEIVLRERASPATFAVFHAYNELTGETFLLFANKSIQGMLLPEAASFDYLIKCTGKHTVAKALAHQIKENEDILTASVIAVRSLKQPERLVYELPDTAQTTTRIKR